MVRLYRLGLALVVSVSACASLPGADTEMIGGRRVEAVSVHHGSGPPVVFKNGLDGTFDWWAKVYPVIAADSSAFAYNRPSIGRSDPADPPPDAAHIVEDLRGTLRAKAFTPPSILVGHSIGGLNMQYFARRYPREVAGLVLVASTHPEQFKGAGSPDHWPSWFRLAVGVAVSGAAQREFQAVTTSGEEMLALP